MEKSMRLPINTRRWMIDRFVRQKERENAEMESARKKSKRK